ncbi:MAG TPA: Gfo/Idh/MocA family oxidoreductase [Planctomycetota bacterium]|nr:Gfo/Idh/MocA family oxidoreductase [Planctomycetota bacterium]
MPEPGRALRAAVVGAGRLGAFHARIYAAHPLAELVAVVDVDEERARALAAELGCRVAETVAELPLDLDLVSIAVPTARHVEVAAPLLERGLACLVEKPLAASAAGAEALLEAARRGGATLSVGHVERFQPGLRKVRELALAPRFIECHRLAPFSFRGTDVGVVHDLMIHDLDLVLELVGSPVASFDAAGGAILTHGEDIASVRLVFENGARANVTASRVSMAPMRRFRMFSADAYVSLDFQKNYGLLVRKGPEWERARAELAALGPEELAARAGELPAGLIEVVELELEGEERPLQAEIDAFLRAVRDRAEPEVTGEDGLRALELADRIAERIGAQGW